MNCRLVFDDKSLEVGIKDRPRLEIQEIEQPDGSYIAGKTNWLPLEIDVEATLWENTKDVKIILTSNDKNLETWLLGSCRHIGNNLIFSNVEYHCEA